MDLEVIFHLLLIQHVANTKVGTTMRFKLNNAHFHPVTVAIICLQRNPKKREHIFVSSMFLINVCSYR
jgi:hypothetical protein